MFIGHFGLGFAARPVARQASLGTLFLACQFADLLWPILVLAGVEHFEIAPGDTVVTPLSFTYYPWSHSLEALLIWGVLFAFGYRLLRRGGPRTLLVIAALVVSHWFLDVLVHRPDLPLTIGGTERYGLGLWNSVPATLAVELSLFAAGAFLYARSTVARDRRGRYGLWALVAFLLIVYLGNLFGPPPPGVAAVAWSAQAMWLLVAWGYWMDRHRRPRQQTGTAAA